MIQGHDVTRIRKQIMTTTIDVSDLSPEAVQIVESLVQELRGRGRSVAPNILDPVGWSKSLRAWASSHPSRSIEIDDSRETIYEGRGE